MKAMTTPTRTRRFAAAALAVGTCVTLLAGCGLRERTTPADEPPGGLDAQAVASAGAWSAGHGGEQLIVFKDGRLVGQAFANGWNAERPHRLYSGTKTFTLALIARMQLDGLIRLDDKAAKFLKPFAEDPAKRDITIGQLLGLVSGIDPLKSDLRKFLDVEPVGDATARALLSPVQHPPGSVFAYGPAAFFVLAAAAKVALGPVDNGDVTAYLQRTVFDPLGIRPAAWTRDDSGQPDFGAGVSMSAANWLTFGQLLLADGSWKGSQILDRAVVKAAQQSGPAYPGYGLGAWLAKPARLDQPANGNAQTVARWTNFQFTDETFQAAFNPPPGTWLAAGAFGQRLYIVPDKNVVIVRTGTGWSFNDEGLLVRLGLASTPPQ